MRKIKWKRSAVLGVALMVTSAFVWSPVGNNRAADDDLFEIRKNTEIFFDVYKYVDAMYVDEPSPGNLMKVGIDAMLQSLDPYTVYIPESRIEDYRFMTTGQYGGVGALIREKENFVIISELYEGFPAQKAGLIPGDVLLEIDGKSLEGKTSEEVSELLKGQAGTPLKLKYRRYGNVEEAELSREEVKIPDVPYSGMVEGKTGYIKLNSFTQTAHKDVDAAFRELKDEGMERLILDLRGNGGGLLIEAVKIVNMFVEKGKPVVEMRGRMEEMNRTYKTEMQPVDTEIPVVVLIDEGSASASEIVAGALQDLDRAVVIGNTSFGKGLVQQTHDLKYNGKIKITIAKYYTPSGRCIQKLDYSHKNADGSVEEVPDSLVTNFYTGNGRIVKDGRGIDPDVFVDNKELSPIGRALLQEDIFFEFANQFYREHESIAPASEFLISDDLYAQFTDFAIQREFDYRTASTEGLERWKELAKNERYFELAKEEYEALLKKITPDPKEDLKRFREQLEMFLLNEIISRYYYEKGQFESSFIADDDLLKAREILSDSNTYNSILDGTFQP